MALKEAEERALLERVAERPELSSYRDAWQQIAAIQERKKALLQRMGSFDSDQYRLAETLVFLAEEDQKPSPERLREYRDSNRESLLQQLFSPAPIYPGLEQVKLADSLSLFVERRGGDEPLVQRVLAGKSPQARAAELLAGTRLADVQQRKQLAEGGIEAIRNSEDPLIQLALVMEDEARWLRQQEEEISEIERQSYARIADAVFAIRGTDTYPDATFTLRLAFGTVRGYEQRGHWIAPWTTMGGAFEHEALHGAKPPWRLPASWRKHRQALDESTPLNFVSTADIIGGNSGSPVVNRDGKLVGVIFDGNIQSLTGDFVYSDDQARAVSVHVAALLEALQKIYGADRLVEELGR